MNEILIFIAIVLLSFAIILNSFVLFRLSKRVFKLEKNFYFSSDPRIGQKFGLFESV